MARCEDFPCCGHELGCCPDYDPDTGQQLNMKCVCGATVPINSRYSLCDSCLYSDDDYGYEGDSYGGIWDEDGDFAGLDDTDDIHAKERWFGA
jgi:hypothetical protein